MGKNSLPNLESNTPSGDTYSLSGKVDKGGIAILGADANVSIQQYFLGLSPQERASQEQQLRDSVDRKISTLKSQVKTPRDVLGNPYYSVESLGFGDKDRLVGREEILQAVVKRINARQVTFLKGNGGVGKTSLIKAGIIPALLEQGHLPLLVTAGNEQPLASRIKSQITDSPLVEKMGLRSFLEFVSQEVKKGRKIFIIIDRLEEFFEQEKADQKAFKALFEVIRTNLPEVHWLFSIHSGVDFCLGLFESEVDVEGNQVTLPPLSRSAGREAIMFPAQAEKIQIEERLLDELLEKCGGEWIDPARLQLLCFALAGGNETNERNWTYKYYESLGKMEGILQTHLEKVIDHFPQKDREPAWEILACLSDESEKILSNEQLFAHMLADLGLDRKRTEEILERLRSKHLIDLETHYRLANASLKKRIQQWLNQRSLQEKAKDEIREQVRSIGASALRGLLGGAIGFGLAYICLPYPARPYGWNISILFYGYLVALRALFGGVFGFAMVLAIDIIASTFSTSAKWRWLFSLIAGGISFALMLAIHTLLGYFGADLLTVLLKSALEGVLWGAITGAGIMLCLQLPERKWLITLGISLVCGLGLMLIDLPLGGLAVSSPLSVALAGMIMPFLLIGFSNIGKHEFAQGSGL